MTTSIQKDVLLSQFSVLAYKDSSYLDKPVRSKTSQSPAAR
ncbi:MAG TPA: hypothetical protein VHK70_02270 [Burkholderiaceae bacterium]|nr:hypothetical protein [Burkholderiaceae bacterium]